MENEFGIDRESQLLVCRQVLPSSLGPPRASTAPGYGIATYLGSRPSPHSPSCRLRWQLAQRQGGSRGATLPAQWGHMEEAERRVCTGEKEKQERRSRVNDNDVVIST